MMKGFCYKDINTIELITVPKPTIQEPTDVIVKMTYASICSSDIHIIKGKVPRAKQGTILGHEGVGIIVEKGESVTNFSIGDHVSINCITFCGECWFCQNGYINNCEKGGWEVGCRINGTLAEYVRIPYANSSLNKIPESISDDECLLVGDVLSSGYFGVEMGNVKENDYVCVIGSGPVGLCSMICAKMRGAHVIALDIKEECLSFAKKLNLCEFALNPNECDVVQKIMEITPHKGCDCTIENAGSDESFQLAWKVTRPNGIVSLVGMYESDQSFPLPFMYGKNLIFKTGGVDAIHCDELIHMIAEKKITTMDLITQRFGFEKVIEAFEFFQKKPEHCAKLAIEF